MDGAPLVTFVKNDLLELVGKTLEAMRKEAFNPKSRRVFGRFWLLDQSIGLLSQVDLILGVVPFWCLGGDGIVDQWQYIDNIGLNIC